MTHKVACDFCGWTDFATEMYNISGGKIDRLHTDTPILDLNLDLCETCAKIVADFLKKWMEKRS